MEFLTDRWGQGDAAPFESETKVRLVRTVAFQRLVVGQMRERPRDTRTHQREELFHQAFDNFEQRLALRERHLDIHLGKLRLAVGAEIFIAEAANDLKVTVHPADHQELLE